VLQQVLNLGLDRLLDQIPCASPEQILQRQSDCRATPVFVSFISACPRVCGKCDLDNQFSAAG